MIARTKPDAEWSAELTAGLPARWRGDALRQWERKRAEGGADWMAQQEANRRANIWLRELLGTLDAAPLPLESGDFEVARHAVAQADKCMGIGQLWGAYMRQGAQVVRAQMAAQCERQGVTPPDPRKVEDAPAIARMTCAMWWRRQLRKVQARAVESAGIALGWVNKARNIYCTDVTLARRQQQIARNAQALENTIAVNEDAQAYTLAELAALGPANKAIRRAELMTRIAGFERIARELDHAGLFLTITCPSRMHKWRTVGGWKVQENPRYDGTNPREANAYLGKVWARIRAELKRREVGLYGFRIAEPQHDGTPHWHMLVFHPVDCGAVLREVVAKHALRDSPNEPGAHAHRVDFVAIDPEKGSAAGYIAKYVAKNIDGYKVEKDLHGNDALETSARVEAWATTWGIRQFQQVGGPPVGVWRELRRVEAIPEGAPDFLKAAHDAVNRVAVIEGRDKASVAWDRYVKAQGGVFCGRNHRIKLAKADPEKTGRYGDAIAPVPIGVECVTREIYKPAHMAHMPNASASRMVHWVVESTRRTWEVITRRAFDAMRAAGRVFSRASLRDGEAGAPRTRVNNCTEGEDVGSDKGATGRGGSGGECVAGGAVAYSDDGRRLRGAADAGG